MNTTGWVLLIGGGLLAAYLILKSGVTYSANPLGNILAKPTAPLPAGQEYQWNGFQWVVGTPGSVAF